MGRTVVNYNVRMVNFRGTSLQTQGRALLWRTRKNDDSFSTVGSARGGTGEPAGGPADRILVKMVLIDLRRAKISRSK